MPRRFLLLPFAVLAFAVWSCDFARAATSELITEAAAARAGLTRPWFAQVEVDPSRGRIGSVILYEGTLYIQTDLAVIHAIDAETGKTLWSKQVGDPKHPSMTPDARGDLLAVINGSQLYVVNRFNGDTLLQKTLDGTVGAGPALSSRRAYVAMMTGMLVGHAVKPMEDLAADKSQKEADRRQNVRVHQEYALPLLCQSQGRMVVQPLVTRDDATVECVVWATDLGYLNFARVECEQGNSASLSLKYRLETGAAIVARPVYLPPKPEQPGDTGVVFVASRDGFVYAIGEEDGGTLWRFSAGEPIVQSPVVADGRVYVTTQLGGMYCLGAKTGKNLWWAPGVAQFVASSRRRVYVADREGRLLVLKSSNGARLDVLDAGSSPLWLMNFDTDRIYLVGGNGLVQCLHEEGLDVPFVHDKARRKKAVVEPAKPKEKEPEKEKPVKKERRAAPSTPPAPANPAVPPKKKEKKEKPKESPKKEPRKGSKAKRGGDSAGGVAPGPGDGRGGRGARPPKGKKGRGEDEGNPF